MPGVDDDQQYLAFMRITLLGMARSGKSSLVNNIVNNSYTPTYSKTTEASLYYTVVRISGEQDSLIEIEDTFASNDIGEVALTPSKTEERPIHDFYDYWWPSTQELTAAELTKLKKMQTKKEEGRAARTLEKPLGLYQAPTDGAFKPLTRNRMAFLIVFDANDEESYKEAVKIYEGLREYHTINVNKMKPVINFVANKTDKDPTSSVFQSVMLSAKAYTQFNSVALRETSALQFKNVKKLFRSIVQAVRSNQALWLLDLGGNQGDEDDGAEGKCIIQ